MECSDVALYPRTIVRLAEPSGAIAECVRAEKRHFMHFNLEYEVIASVKSQDSGVDTLSLEPKCNQNQLHQAQR